MCGIGLTEWNGKSEYKNSSRAFALGKRLVTELCFVAFCYHLQGCDTGTVVIPSIS